MGRSRRHSHTLTYLGGGFLFFGSALILQTTQTGGVGAFDVSGTQPTQRVVARPPAGQPVGGDLDRHGEQFRANHSDGALTSCVAHAGSRADRAFAFDGTVVGVQRITGKVTFRVHEWFAGGHRSRVTVQMTGSTRSATWEETSESAPPHPIGARLLVSGEPRWGGPPLRHPYAWGCGFTIPYQRGAAADWRSDSERTH